ncbi:MAG: sulfurtransferase [Kocuria sp.]|nr:sulfurtransferase [Kocuria sp.]
MTTGVDTTNPKFADYAHPERLVSTAWVASHGQDDGVVVIESDEDVLLYDTGHIPGSIKVDWHTELNLPEVRDYLDGAQFAELMSSKGISRDDTVVIYGDKSNWWAAYALWVFTLFGHQDVRLMDGGRDKWVTEGRELVTDTPQRNRTEYPQVQRHDTPIRIYQSEVLKALGSVPLIDVRSHPEYTGQRTHMAEYPQEGVLRGGHIPTAASVPWAQAAEEDATFKPRAQLEEIYQQNVGLEPHQPVIAYCRIGERSAHTWFVLKYLLGFPDVRNYDGSWTEWGNSVRVPIVSGPEPGNIPGESQ